MHENTPEKEVPDNLLFKDESFEIVGAAIEVWKTLGFFADILVNDSIILELKTGDEISQNHKSQSMHYLKATRMRFAIIVNFSQQRLEFKRIIV